jgi:hypothetical protein
VKKPSTTIGSTTDTESGTPIADADLSTFDRKEPRFALADEIGRGGMGRVLAATDVALARSVAIKQMLSDGGDDLARFEREVKITAQLEHPSIVPIHEAGLDPRGRPYYVMRRIEGEQLSARLEGKDTGARLALLPNLLAVVDAAAFAHARKIIHRDIKPTNILLGAYGETWLIDWGLARRLDDLDVSNPRPSGANELTRVGHVYGTIAYMAPEQARGEPVDERADVYALGATLFHVLAGRGPFAALSEAERIAAAEAREDRAPIETLSEDVPPELVAIVDKAMARDPDARYQHAGELATDLRAFLAGKLVAAHRYTFAERVARFVRQHRFAVFTILIAVFAMVFVSVLAFGRILAAKDQAEAVNVDLQKALLAADERSQTLSLDRASTLAPTDPARAVAIIRELAPDSPFAARARDILAIAAAHGLPHGATVHDKQINGLAFSSDRRWLASTGEDGKIAIHEVATGKTRVVRDYKTGIGGVAWSGGDRKVLFSLGTSMRALDVETGSDELVATASVDRWWVHGTKVRILDNEQHKIVEVPVGGGALREVVGNVAFANGDDFIVFTRNDSTAGVLIGDTVRELQGPIPGPATAVAASRRAGQVAIASSKEVASWNLDTGTLNQRWQVPLGMWLAFGPYHPLLITGTGRLIALHANGTSSDRLTHINSLVAGQIKTGLVYALSNGSLFVIDTLGSHTVTFDRPGTRAIATTPDGMLVATGTGDGGVEWLDLATAVPPPIEVPPQAQLCIGNDKQLVWASTEAVERYDLATAKRTEITRDAQAFLPGFACTLPVGSQVGVIHHMQASLMDLDRGTLVPAPGDGVIAVDTEAGRLMWADGNDIRERRADGGEGIRFRAPVRIDRFASVGRWTVVLSGTTLLRHAHDTGRTETLALPDIVEFGVTPDGSVWLSSGPDISWWRRDTATTDKIHTFDSPIFHGRWLDNKLFVSLMDGSLWTLDRAPPTNRGRRGRRRGVDLGHGQVAVTVDSEHLTIHYLATGEKLARDVPQLERTWVMEDGRSVAAKAGRWFVIYKDVVPPDFKSALAWIDRATNARFDATSNSMLWKIDP